MSKLINLTIDGVNVQAEEGETVLSAAKRINIDIPTLCFLKEVNATGDCRMCVVEIEGRRGFIPSCITGVEEGMKVTTNKPEIEETRKIMLDLLLSAHDKKCLTCVRAGNCELQELAEKFGITEIEYPGEEVKKHIDDKSPIVRDTGKCIMCKRCVSTCKEIQEVSAIDVVRKRF